MYDQLIYYLTQASELSKVVNALQCSRIHSNMSGCYYFDTSLENNSFNRKQAQFN